MLGLIITSIIGVIVAVIIFIIQQFLSKFSIEFVHNLSKLRENICYNLIYYANRYTCPSTMKDNEKDELQKILRESATQLVSKSNIIPWYRFLSLLRLVPSKNNIYKASTELIGLSNSLFEGKELENVERRDKVEKYLNIPSKK